MRRTLRRHLALVAAAFSLGSCGGESVIGLGPSGAGGGGGTGVGGAGAVMTGIGGAAAVMTGGTGMSAGTGGFFPEGGSSGNGGSAGASLDPSLPCDIQEALTKSCGRTGCHSLAVHYADLTLVDPSVGQTYVDKVATHGDIGCAPPGERFRECQPFELPASCPDDALLIDSLNPEQSWMLKKLRGEHNECGARMPAPPGDSTSNGWSEARRECIEAWIYSLAAMGPVR